MELALTIAAGILIAYACIALAPLIVALMLGAIALVAFILFCMFIGGPGLVWLFKLPPVWVYEWLGYAFMCSPIVALSTPLLGWLSDRYRTARTAPYGYTAGGNRISDPSMEKTDPVLQARWEANRRAGLEA